MQMRWRGTPVFTSRMVELEKWSRSCPPRGPDRVDGSQLELAENPQVSAGLERSTCPDQNSNCIALCFILPLSCFRPVGPSRRVFVGLAWLRYGPFVMNTKEGDRRRAFRRSRNDYQSGRNSMSILAAPGD